MNGIYESYDHIPEAIREYDDAWDEKEPASSTTNEEEHDTTTHQK